jgi:hypothetical protein
VEAGSQVTQEIQPVTAPDLADAPDLASPDLAGKDKA